jgi:predicted NUDIX family NTP pyrophosphohydrolase
MTIKHSYGIVLYRTGKHGKVEIFLCKANGIRYWSSLRTKIWGIPKGRPELDESPIQTAMREFHEETGNLAPGISYSKLCDFQTPHNKIITAFIGDATAVKGIKFRGSNVIEAEYPAGSGTIVRYPEIADARWIELDKAENIMMFGQKDMLHDIKKHIKKHA